MMRPPFAILARVALVCLPLCAADPAAAASGQERLIQLDQIAISHDLCGFPLGSAQEQVLTSESEALADDLNLQPEDAQRLYDQFAESMRRQRTTGLCDPKGEWAATYAKLVATLGP